MKKRLMVLVVFILSVVTVMFIGTSYAYYDSVIVGNTKEKTLVATSDIISVEFSDGSESFGNATETQGGADVVPGSTYQKVFTVTNNSNGKAYFSIVLDELENTFQRNQDWTYTLENKIEVISEGTIAVGTKQILVPKVGLDANETIEYIFVLRYNKSTEDQTGDIGSSLKFKINIQDETVTWDNPEAPSWAPVGSTTLLSKIKANQPRGTIVTIPGQVPSAEDEKRILATEDDYGTSYVYRGNVENNYVNFAGMCWRIVRVQGDGTIKIVLADRDNECNEVGYSVANGSSAFIADPSTHGFAYKYVVTGKESDLVYENSDIRGTLDAWLSGGTYRYKDMADTRKILDGTFTASISLEEQEKLAAAEWCNDLSVTSKVFYDSPGGNIIEDPDETLISYTDKYYGAYDRLNKRFTASLKCNSVGADGSTAEKYPSKIGVLSADEVAFAGATRYESGLSWNYYLKTNATGNDYWTLSPYNFDVSDYSLVWYVYSSGNLNGREGNDDEDSIRPAVVLRSDILLDGANTSINEQDGTQTHPYEV